MVLLSYYYKYQTWQTEFVCNAWNTSLQSIESLMLIIRVLGLFDNISDTYNIKIFICTLHQQNNQPKQITKLSEITRGWIGRGSISSLWKNLCDHWKTYSSLTTPNNKRAFNKTRQSEKLIFLLKLSLQTKFNL